MKNPSAKNLAAACIASLMMLFGLAPGLSAAELQIAVAANFAAPIKTITQDFQRDTGHQVSLAIGATGQFYAQIRNGAPFGILLAADDETPLRLEREGFGVTGSRATYAIGRLVLWSPVPDMVDANGSILKSDRIGKIAIANPKLAPYGAAAVEVLERMGVHPESLKAPTLHRPTSLWRPVMPLWDLLHLRRSPSKAGSEKGPPGSCHLNCIHQSCRMRSFLLRAATTLPRMPF